MAKILVPGLVIKTEGVIRPDPFQFTDQSGVLLSTDVFSDSITVTGTPPQYNLAISVDIGQYRINGGAWTGADGSCVLGDVIELRHTSSNLYLTQTQQRLTIEGVFDIFISTTIADVGDTVLWDQPAFWGYSKAPAASITMNTLFTNVTSGVAPLVVHASASNVTATGTNDLDGSAIEPYLHLEHRWNAALSGGAAIPSAGEITDPNTRQAVNMYTDQIGGESCFIFHNPGTYEITLTSTAANGTFGTVTETITVASPESAAAGQYDHIWFDPDFGNDANDGRDPWGFNLTAGTYTASTGRIVLTGGDLGKFDAGSQGGYNHTAATAQTYLTDNYNTIALFYDAAWHWHRIAAYIDGNEIELEDGPATNKTVSSSTGPKETFTASTDVSNNTAHHFKVGKIYAVTSSIDLGSATGMYFMGWGGSGRYTFQSQVANGIVFSKAFNDVWFTQLNLHKMIIDGNYIGGGFTGTGYPLDMLDERTDNYEFNMDRVKIFNHFGKRISEIQGAGRIYSVWWGCELDNVAKNAEPEKASTRTSCGAVDGSMHAIIGCDIWSETNETSPSLEHHYYPRGKYGHRLRAFNDFLANISPSSVNFCFNESCGNDLGDPVANYNLYRGNRIRNANFGIAGEASSSNRADAGLGYFGNTIVIGNSFDGDGLDGIGKPDETINNQGGSGIFWYGTQSSFVGHNIGFSLRRDLYEQALDGPDIATWKHYFDGNVVYNCEVANVGGSSANFQIANTIGEHTSTTANFLTWNSTGNASAYIADSQVYAPNDIDSEIFDDAATTPLTITELNNNYANNSNNIISNPNFTDPSTKDFRSTQTDVQFAVVPFTIPLSNPTPSILITDPPGTLNVDLPTGFGTPKAIMVICSGALEEAPNGYANGSMAIGFSDGTTNLCAYAMHDSEVTPTQDCYRTLFNTDCIVRTQSIASTRGTRHALSVRSFETDRVVFDINVLADFDSHAREMTMIAIGGSGVQSVSVGSTSLGNTATPVNVNLGFEPDLVFTGSIHSNAFVNYNGGVEGGQRSSLYDCEISAGVGINTPTPKEMSFNWMSANAVNPTQDTVAISTNAVVKKLVDGATESYRSSISAYSATGFTFTPNTSNNNSIVNYLAIKFTAQVEMDIVNTTIPTVGDISVTSTVNNPGFGYWFNVEDLTAYDTPEDTSFALGVTAFDRTNMRTKGLNAKDGVTNTDQGAIARMDDNLQLMDGSTFGGTPLEMQTSGYTLTTNGVNLPVTQNPATQILGRMLLLGVN